MAEMIFAVMGGVIGGLLVLIGEFLWTYLKMKKWRKQFLKNKVIAETEAQEAEKEYINPGADKPKIHIVTEEDEWAREQDR